MFATVVTLLALQHTDAFVAHIIHLESSVASVAPVATVAWTFDAR